MLKEECRPTAEDESTSALAAIKRVQAKTNADSKTTEKLSEKKKRAKKKV